jgi:hypothetical protein
VSVLAGAGMQRMTGMGLTLVASPLLVLLLGNDGVSLLMALGFASSITLVIALWSKVEVRTAGKLFVPALVGLIPGAWLIRVLPAPVLSIVLGLLVVVAILASVLSDRARVFKGTPGLLSAGFLSGFMNAISGIGGPPVVLYALSTGWAQESFVATLQLYFTGLSLATLGARGWPVLDASVWFVAFAALAAGLFLGNLLSRRVSSSTARWLMIAIALAGASAAIVKGVAALV